MIAYPQHTSGTNPRLFHRTAVKYAKIDVEQFLSRFKPDDKLNNLLEHLPNGAYIAGGFWTNLILEEKAKDIDFFFENSQAFDITYKYLNSIGYRSLQAKEKDYSKDTPVIDLEKTGELPIQLIKIIWHNNIEHVIDGFDFTVAQFASDGYNLYFNPVSFVDLYQKWIVVHNIAQPDNAMYRLLRYKEKGFKASEKTLADLTQAIRDSAPTAVPRGSRATRNGGIRAAPRNRYSRTNTITVNDVAINYDEIREQFYSGLSEITHYSAPETVRVLTAPAAPATNNAISFPDVDTDIPF